MAFITILPILASFFIAGIVYAWTEPGSAPPAGSVATPVNEGSMGQMKSGALLVGGGFESTGQTLLSTLSGKLGVGTTAPADQMELYSNATANSLRLSGNRPILRFNELDTTDTNWQIDINGGTLRF